MKPTPVSPVRIVPNLPAQPDLTNGLQRRLIPGSYEIIPSHKKSEGASEGMPAIDKTLRTPVVTLKGDNGKFYGYLAVAETDGRRQATIFDVLGHPIGVIQDRDVFGCWPDSAPSSAPDQRLAIFAYDEPNKKIGWLNQTTLGGSSHLMIEAVTAKGEKRQIIMRSGATQAAIDCWQLDGPGTVGPTFGDYIGYQVDVAGNIVGFIK